MVNRQLVSIYSIKYIKQFYIKLYKSVQKMTLQVYLPHIVKMVPQEKAEIKSNGSFHIFKPACPEGTSTYGEHENINACIRLSK